MCLGLEWSAELETPFGDLLGVYLGLRVECCLLDVLRGRGRDVVEPHDGFDLVQRASTLHVSLREHNHHLKRQRLN